MERFLQSGQGPGLSTSQRRPVSWGAFLATYLATDAALHDCIRQTMQRSESYELARAAFEAGVPTPMLQQLLLRAAVEGCG